jgi:hypothetical protein
MTPDIIDVTIPFAHIHAQKGGNVGWRRADREVESMKTPAKTKPTARSPSALCGLNI